MRSRYSAYAKGLVPYLRDTWHPLTRPADLQIDPDLRWTGLTIVGTEAGGVDDESGVVEFVAEHASAAGPGRLHERSRFGRVDGAWRYIDGETR